MESGRVAIFSGSEFHKVIDTVGEMTIYSILICMNVVNSYNVSVRNWVSNQCEEWFGEKLTGETRKTKRKERQAATPQSYVGTTKRVLSREGPEFQMCTSAKQMVRVGNGQSDATDETRNGIMETMEAIRKAGTEFPETGACL